jgi:hypothetical protein
MAINNVINLRNEDCAVIIIDMQNADFYDHGEREISLKFNVLTRFHF